MPPSIRTSTLKWRSRSERNSVARTQTGAVATQFNDNRERELLEERERAPEEAQLPLMIITVIRFDAAPVNDSACTTEISQRGQDLREAEAV